MKYTDKIWKRATMEQIREFVLHGDEDKTGRGKATYKERLAEATVSMRVRIEEKYEDTTECEEVNDDFSHALTVYADVYTEIGMKLGARMIFQLLHLDDKSLME